MEACGAICPSPVLLIWPKVKKRKAESSLSPGKVEFLQVFLQKQTTSYLPIMCHRNEKKKKMRQFLKAQKYVFLFTFPHISLLWVQEHSKIKMTKQYFAQRGLFFSSNHLKPSSRTCQIQNNYVRYLIFLPCCYKSWKTMFRFSSMVFWPQSTRIAFWESHTTQQN